MRELSLFTGAGGGLLGTKLLDWEHIGYVEINEYCQRVIAQRIADGILDRAPIFTDVREFLESGAAEQYRGFADVVTGGFPCQPFSVAGKQQGENDPRNMWPATIAIIRAVRPRFAFLENVPGLLARSHRYFEKILKDLAESGYDARWRIISAAEVGAPHKRDRLWIVADDMRDGIGLQQELSDRKGQADVDHDGQERVVADSGSQGLQGSTQNQFTGVYGSYEPFQRGELMRGITEAGRDWPTEPGVGRVADGVANRVERIKALGNGQVPVCVAAAWTLLAKEFV